MKAFHGVVCGGLLPPSAGSVPACTDDGTPRAVAGSVETRPRMSGGTDDVPEEELFGDVVRKPHD